MMNKGPSTFCLFIFVIAPLLRAQGTETRIDLSPANPTTMDDIAYKLVGTWQNGCAPQTPQVSVSGSVVQIKTSNPGQACTQALTPWILSGSVGRLPAGAYDLVVEHSAAGSTTPLEIARKSFLVSGSASINELIFPVVANGVVLEKLFYQTIFTVLNTSGYDVAATLQVYDSTGKTAGAFCSPLAPPPSSMAATLKPNAQLFQFTSADLPFLNGWARLRWEGGAPILASEELSLVASTPARCLLVCNHPSTEKVSSTQIYGIKPAREFRFPVTLNTYRQTALTLVNPSPTETATVKVSILNISGESASLSVPDSFELHIGPLERVSKFLWQMGMEHSALTVIPPPPEAFQGTVVVSADVPIAAGSLNIMFPEGKFVAVPVVPTLP